MVLLLKATSVRVPIRGSESRSQVSPRPVARTNPGQIARSALFFSLVSSRYERSSLIVSSNKSFSAWAEIFGVNSTRFVGQRSCLFHAATPLVAEANASRGVLCPWRPMSHWLL